MAPRRGGSGGSSSSGGGGGGGGGLNNGGIGAANQQLSSLAFQGCGGCDFPVVSLGTRISDPSVASSVALFIIALVGMIAVLIASLKVKGSSKKNKTPGKQKVLLFTASFFVVYQAVMSAAKISATRDTFSPYEPLTFLLDNTTTALTNVVGFSFIFGEIFLVYCIFQFLLSRLELIDGGQPAKKTSNLRLTAIVLLSLLAIIRSGMGFANLNEESLDLFTGNVNLFMGMFVIRGIASLVELGLSVELFRSTRKLSQFSANNTSEIPKIFLRFVVPLFAARSIFLVATWVAAFFIWFRHGYLVAEGLFIGIFTSLIMAALVWIGLQPDWARPAGTLANNQPIQVYYSPGVEQLHAQVKTDGLVQRPPVSQQAPSVSQQIPHVSQQQMPFTGQQQVPYNVQQPPQSTVRTSTHPMGVAAMAPPNPSVQGLPPAMPSGAAAGGYFVWVPAASSGQQQQQQQQNQIHQQHLPPGGRVPRS